MDDSWDKFNFVNVKNREVCDLELFGLQRIAFVQVILFINFTEISSLEDFNFRFPQFKIIDSQKLWCMNIAIAKNANFLQFLNQLSQTCVKN